MKVQNRNALVIKRSADNRYYDGETSHRNPWCDLKDAKVYVSLYYGKKALKLLADKSGIACTFSLIRYATEYEVRNNGNVIEVVDSIEVKPARIRI